MSEQNEKNVEILIEDIENHDELWGIRRQYPKALFDLERLFILVEINSQYKLEAITRDYPNTLFDKENSIALIPRKKDIPSSGWTFNRSLLFCGLICLQQCIKTESSPKTTTP